MDKGRIQRREGRGGKAEYRLALPEQIDPRQLVLALEEMAARAKDAPTLSEFAPRFLSEHARANRHKVSGVETNEYHFRVYLLPAMGETRLSDISLEQVQALKGALAELAAKTVNNILSTLSSALKFAVQIGELRCLPCRVEPLPEQDPPVRFYEKDEYGRLVEGATAAGALNLAVVLLGGDCGLRKGEMISLEWGDVDFSRAKLHIQRAETRGKVSAPKGGKSRLVPMPARALEALRRLPRTPGPRVLYRDDGEPMIKHRLVTPVSQAERWAGMPHKGLHILRHTYCSHLAMAGVPVRTIMEYAGHTEIQTTLRYMHLAPSECDRVMEQLERYRER